MSKLSLLAAHELHTDALERVSGGCGGYRPSYPQGGRQNGNSQGGNTIVFNGDFINNGSNNTFNFGNNSIG